MSTDKTPPIDREAVRAMVRQVLRDAIPETVRKRIATEVNKAPAAAPAADVAADRAEDVTLVTDADVAAFVHRILRLARDPKQREAMESGRLAFRLKGARTSEPVRSAGGERIDKGLLTERAVIAAAKAGKRLVVGRHVVLTPLARDKARQLGVEIERE
jgi:hypothetical protein